MRRLLVALACIAAAACVDQEQGSPVSPRAPRSNNTASSDLSRVQTHWRSANELWAYDMTPEVGLHTHFPVGELVRQNLDQIANAHVRMVRVGYKWDHADPSGNGSPSCGSYPKYGCYYWTSLDNINAAINLGLEPVVNITEVPMPFRHYPGPLDPGPTQPNEAQLQATWSAFARFMVDLVTALPRVKYYQILNEQDGGHAGVNMLGGVTQTWENGAWRFDYQTQGRNYARFMKMVYDSIKSRNPNAWVVMGGLTGTPYMDPNGYPISRPNWGFLHAFYQNGGRNYVDIPAIHAYGHAAASDGTGLTAKGTAVRNVMSLYGDATAPLWLTEFGRDAATAAQESPGNSPWSGSFFDQDQRNHWVEVMDRFSTLNQYQKAFGYSTSQGGVGAPPAGATIDAGLQPGDYGLGIFRLDQLTPRPAYTALQQHPVNNAVRSYPYSSGSLQVYAPGKYPVGYQYYHDGSYVTIYGVTVDKLFPLKIMFQSVGSPEPCEPVWPALSC